MRVETLRDICEINPGFDGGQDPEELCSFVPMEFVDDAFAEIVRTQTRHISEVQKGYTPFRNDDVLLAKITPCMENGKCAIAKTLVNGIGFGSTEFHVMRVGEFVTPEWIYYFIRQTYVRKQLALKMRGSAGQKRVPAEAVGELLLPLPPRPEQRRIAAVLNKTDHLRHTRRYAAKLSDTLLQAVFVRMFGDVARNPMDWEIYTLRGVAIRFSDGPFGSDLKTEHYTDSGVRVIRLQNIGVGELIDDDQVYISQEHFDELARHRCEPGDVIVGTLGEPNLRACILPPSIPIALNKADCTQIRVDNDIANAEYICWLLNMPSTLLLATGMILGETRARISMGRLAELRVPIPPLALQQEFACIVQRFERLRAQQREAQRQAEHLFQTLLHRAFNDAL